MPDEITQPKPLAIVIASEVKESLSKFNIRRLAVDQLVDEEAKVRTNLIVKALSERRKAEQDVRKTKPDNTTYDAEGNVKEESFTKAKIDELKKIKERIAKIDKSLTEAIDKADYKELKNLLAQQK